MKVTITNVISTLAMIVYSIGVLAGLVALLRGKLDVTVSVSRTLLSLIGWPLVCVRDLVDAARGVQRASLDATAPEEQRLELTIGVGGSGAGLMLLGLVFAVGLFVGVLIRGVK